MFVEFINLYGAQILNTLVTAIFGYLGIVAKTLVKKFFNDKTKRAVARDAVKFVEQVFKNLHGDDKLNEAMKAASEMLAEKGITITELELRVLIEAAVAEFNNAFEEKTK